MPQTVPKQSQNTVKYKKPASPAFCLYTPLKNRNFAESKKPPYGDPQAAGPSLRYIESATRPRFIAIYGA